ncbi:hypothetical protein I553_4084 [Mycobacterium xenopi 4042]|uniref:Uncharacterized protein n=1 Tax=Mycobacterium xenopi 4042 TaxID=1299334 RepID=X8AFB1_MYCXE|nr:hypothetical protein I553_4084 [Mycobacterium xenopi 4042]EUA50523.1 hypothetical protein I552_1459 [Mycobacterium xenopi 3993]
MRRRWQYLAVPCLQLALLAAAISAHDRRISFTKSQANR